MHFGTWFCVLQKALRPQGWNGQGSLQLLSMQASLLKQSESDRQPATVEKRCHTCMSIINSGSNTDKRINVKLNSLSTHATFGFPVK